MWERELQSLFWAWKKAQRYGEKIWSFKYYCSLQRQWDLPKMDQNYRGGNFRLDKVWRYFSESKRMILFWYNTLTNIIINFNYSLFLELNTYLTNSMAFPSECMLIRNVSEFWKNSNVVYFFRQEFLRNSEIFSFWNPWIRLAFSIEFVWHST